MFKSYSNTFCSGVSFGLDNEIDQSSFVTCLDKKFNNHVEVQEYIINNITIGDTVNLIKNDDIYYIYHNGTIIGRMSLDFNKSLRNSMQGVTYNYRLPIKISDVYISNIVTFVNTSHIDTDFPIYKKSRIFFGVELSGIGKTYFK